MMSICAGRRPSCRPCIALSAISACEKDRIAYEFFGPATVLEPAPAARPPPPSATHGQSLAADAVTVEFRKSGLTAVWDEESRIAP